MDSATSTGRPGWGRWGLAVAAAAALAAWPACAVDLGDAPAAGQPARLDFTLKDMHGADVRLASFKGKPLILNFWATWCGPCKIEIPAFVELVEQYRARELTVLGISVDDAPEDLRPFAAEFKINYPVLVGLGHDELQETYDAVLMIPVTWFIRPDGTVMLKHKGPATKAWLETQVQALLAPPAQERP